MGRVSLSILVLFMLISAGLMVLGSTTNIKSAANLVDPHSSSRLFPTLQATSVTSLPVVAVFSAVYGSSNIVDTSLGVGSTFSVQITIANAPAFNAFEFWLFYDPNFINATGFDLFQGTVFSNGNPSNLAPHPFSVVGRQLRLAVVNFANPPSFTGGNGILANIFFTVLKVGESPLVLSAPIASTQGGGTQLVSNQTPILVTTSDGYFRNDPSSRVGPVASFTWTPASPTQGDEIIFNATSSFDPDGGKLTLFTWEISGGNSYSSSSPTFQIPLSAGRYSVRLTVTDSDDNFQGMQVQLVTVAPIVHDIGLTLFTGSTPDVAQGLNVSFTVNVANFVSTTETYNLTLTYAPPNLTFVRLNGLTIPPFGTAAFFLSLNTSSLALGTYTIKAIVADSLDNNPSNNAASLQLQVIAPDEIPVASFTYTPTNPIAGQPVSFNGRNSVDPDGTIQIWHWNFGDGSFQETQTENAVHFYLSPGNYSVTLTVGDTSGLTASGSLTIRVLPRPPPVITLDPASGPEGTLVTIHGSGFLNPIFPPVPVYVAITFDNQFIGSFEIQSSSFNFSFDVPVAQPGAHQVHAISTFPPVDAQAVFTVTPLTQVGLSVSVGSIYFPGDTATILVLTSINGVPSSVDTIAVVLIKPDGTNLTLSVIQDSTGRYRAYYKIPLSGPIGTYAAQVVAHKTGSLSGSALAGFEVKPSWLSSNGRNIATGAAVVGLVGVTALAWRRGYFKRSKEEPFES